MFGELKRLFKRYFFICTVIGCTVMFFCGTLTAEQKTAYNIYLREYAVMSMANTSRSINMSIGEKSLSVALPDENQRERLKKYLKLTPLSPFVLLFSDKEQKISESY